MVSKEEQVPDYMLPKNDFIFRKLFGSEGNESITKELVETIIGEKIKTLEFKNPYLIRDAKKDKEEILDIKVELDNNTLCDIEIQVGNYHDVDKRILDYWAKLYRTSIEKGSNYINMKKTIVIFIAAYYIDNLRGIEEYKTRWKIIEEKLKIELTNIFEIDIIELSKAEKYFKKNKVEKQETKNWINFLINPKKMEGIQMEKMSKEIQKAYELWQNMNLTEEEREVAERRYKDMVALEHAKKYEYEQGREKGKEEGEKIEKIKIAKEMLKKKMPIELISEITQMSKEEIENLPEGRFSWQQMIKKF